VPSKDYCHAFSATISRRLRAGRSASEEIGVRPGHCAFSEGIRLEPEAPNPYVGRALAYRSLGDEANAAADERQAKELGGMERRPGIDECAFVGEFQNPS